MQWAKEHTPAESPTGAAAWLEEQGYIPVDRGLPKYNKGPMRLDGTYTPLYRILEAYAAAKCAEVERELADTKEALRQEINCQWDKFLESKAKENLERAESAESKVAELEREREWIPVTPETMPPKTLDYPQRFLVIYKGEIRIAEYGKSIDGTWCFWRPREEGNGINLRWHVTHWRELPAPPEVKDV
jgi:hypothetical protein